MFILFNPNFRKKMEKLFLGFYDSYWSVINENMTSTGKPMMVRNNYVHLHNGANFFIYYYQSEMKQLQYPVQQINCKMPNSLPSMLVFKAADLFCCVNFFFFFFFWRKCREI